MDIIDSNEKKLIFCFSKKSAEIAK